MKKMISLILVLAMCAGCCAAFAGCESGSGTDFTVGVCQLMKHDSLDAATKGFQDALTEELAKAGKTVSIDVQVAGESGMCVTVVNNLVSAKVDLLMANATPALLAAANKTSSIPILGTSVTDYADTFGGIIPQNVSGTSDAVPFDLQAQMMIDTLGLTEGDQVGVIYCSNESNSKIQYDAVKALFDEKGIVCKAYTFSENTELRTVTQTAAAPAGKLPFSRLIPGILPQGRTACKSLFINIVNKIFRQDCVLRLLIFFWIRSFPEDRFPHSPSTY